MTMMSGSSPIKVIQLSDSDGDSAVEIRNSKGFTVHELNSNGDHIRKGRSIKK